MCSTTGNKDVLVQRVLVALYPQHALAITDENNLTAPACNAQAACRPSNSQHGQVHPTTQVQLPTSQQYHVSSFAAIPPMNNPLAFNYPSNGIYSASLLQPSTSPRVQVHLRAAAPAPPHNARMHPIVAQHQAQRDQQSAISSHIKDAAARWSHPMFERLASETFVFTHPVTIFQGTLPFDVPQSSSIEKILIVPFTRRYLGSSLSVLPLQLNKGPSVAVTWNNIPVEIPKYVHVKSKLASATVHNHPMFVPKNAPFKPGSNRLYMSGGGAENVIGVAVILVRPRQLADLEALVRSHPMSKITKRPEFNENDDDCAATFVSVQLKDPLTLCRIQIPVKTVKCKHSQCFDLATFIQYCERSGIWYCPCCPNKPGLSIDDVYVDQFFSSIIKDASDTNTVYVILSTDLHHVLLIFTQVPEA